MTHATTSTNLELSAAEIRAARTLNPKMRERDLAQILEISEAELVASFVGHGCRRIAPRFEVLFEALKGVGEVMVLTRNESVVHEKVGHFEKFINGERAALMLGQHIDTRMFPYKWVHGYAINKAEGKTVRRSLQFFDAHGDAVQKIYARPGTNMDAWNRLVEKLSCSDQTKDVLPSVTPAEPFSRKEPEDWVGAQIRNRWATLKDVHQFHGMLRELNIDRLNAFELAGEDWAWPLDNGSVNALLRLAASEEIPIMCFVGNRGCIQIHSGAIENVFLKGPWINVMDSNFHLHLRTDHIAEVWAVRKPSDSGHVTSVEAYNSEGQQIVQFYGVRGEGNPERSDWRELAESLPRMERTVLMGAAE